MINEVAYEIIKDITEKYGITFEDLISYRDSEGNRDKIPKKIKKKQKLLKERKPVDSYTIDNLPRGLWWSKFVKAGYTVHKNEGGTEKYIDYVRQAKEEWGAMNDDEKAEKIKQLFDQED